jgi:uroporphyrinogen decarboxylase
MTASERLKAMVEKRAFDKVGASAWWHMPTVDRYAEKFVPEIIRFTDTNQWDFIKVMHNPHFFSEAYGADIEFLEDPKEWAGKINRYPIVHAEDLEKLPVITVRDNRALLREVLVVKKLAEHYKGSVPIIPTLFTPITWVQEMTHSTVPDETLGFIRNNKKELHKALETILEVTLKFIDELVQAGADGFFIASQYGKKKFNDAIFTESEFDEFEFPFTKAIVGHLKGITWFNMLHIHGDRDLRVEKFLDLDVQAINWENTHPDISGGELTSIAYIRSLTDKIIISGVDREKSFDGPLPKVKEQLKKFLKKALKETKDNRLILAPGCGLELSVNEKSLFVLREVVDEFGIIDKGVKS